MATASDAFFDEYEPGPLGLSDVTNCSAYGATLLDHEGATGGQFEPAGRR